MKEEDVLNNAIREVKRGAKPGNLVFPSGLDAEQMTDYASIAQELLHIPKNIVPTPLMRRKYATAKIKTRVWTAVFHFSRLANVTLSLAVLLTALGTTTYATIQSLPGQKLFTLKKGAEQIQAKLTSDPIEKAGIYVALSEKRLKEAELVLSSKTDNPKAQMAALSELSKQTKNAVEEMQKAAQQNSLQEKDKQMVDALESLTRKQQDLLKQIKPQEANKELAATAMEATKDNESKLTEIKKNLTIAAADREQALASLSPDPDIVQMSGTVSLTEKYKITVEKTSFYLQDGTIVRDQDNKPIKAADLVAKSKVNVIGVKDGDRIIAKEITVVSPYVASEVKGTSTASSSKVSTGTVSTSTQKSMNENEKTAPAEMEIVNPNTAKAGFIIEDPNPQFAP